MDIYGKVFRKYSENSLDVTLKSYDPNLEKYHEIVLEMKKRGYRQVIINSEIMIKILNDLIMKDGHILQIKFTDNTDENLVIDVKNLVSKIRHDRLLFVTLKDVLNWALDNNSIDIVSVELYYKNEIYTIYSNGLVEGRKIDIIFGDIIKKVILDYL